MWLSIFVVLAAAAGTIFLAIVAYLLYIHKKYDHIPGPKRDSFFFGNLPFIWHRRKTNGEALCHSLIYWVKMHGHTFRIFFAHRPVVFTCDPAGIKEIYTTGPDFPKPANPYGDLGFMHGQRVVGHGIFSQLDEERYKFQRNSLNPAFTKQHLESMMLHFNDVGDALVENLLRCAEKKTVIKMYDKIQQSTLDVISKIAFGNEINCLIDDNIEIVKAFHAMTDGMSDIVNSFFVPFFLDRKISKKDFITGIRFLRGTGKKWLLERCKAIEAGDYVPEDALTLWIKAYGLTAKGHVPVEVMETVIDEWITVFFAGHHTTSIGMTFALQEVGRNPHILKRLRDEIDSVIGSRRYITTDDLNKMEYSNMVFAEALRYWNSVPWLFRTNVKETTIEGYKVPPKTGLLVSPFVSCRIPEFYPDVDVFNPDRFAPDSKITPSKYIYFPFALGHRNCIGQNLAKMESRVVMAKVLQRIDIHLDMNQNFDCYETFLLEPKDGVRCTVTARE